jgi:hypothetical protein
MVPAFGLISQHPRYADIGQGPDGRQVRKFVASEGFGRRFSRTTAIDVYKLVARNATWKRRGPVVGGIDVLTDDAGAHVKFALDGFSNTYEVLTYGCMVA